MSAAESEKKAVSLAEKNADKLNKTTKARIYIRVAISKLLKSPKLIELT
jgi:hypothetical protein